jgi:hypothetical protein
VDAKRLVDRILHEQTLHEMSGKWEIVELDKSPRSVFYVMGINHYSGEEFRWHLRDLRDSRFFATPQTVVTPAAERLLAKLPQDVEGL